MRFNGNCLLSHLVAHFLLRSGEGNAVAVNILLVSMLEEMYKAEQLWASHAGSSKLSTQSSR